MLAAAAAVVVVVALFVVLRDSTPRLTRESLERAVDLWQKNRLPDYDLHLVMELDAGKAKHYLVEVRSDKVTKFSVDGIEMDRPSDAYSVDGLFDIMDRELTMAAAPDPEPGQPKHARLAARFHETLGAPLVFHRIAPERKSFFLRVVSLSVPGQGRVFPAGGENAGADSQESK